MSSNFPKPERHGHVNDAGFTLVEVLAALSVFAIAAIGLIHVSAENTKGALAIENRMLASIVADNEMTLTLAEQLPLDDGVSTGRVSLGGRDWEWRRTIKVTPNPLVQEIKIETWQYVPDSPDDKQVSISLSAFKGKSR